MRKLDTKLQPVSILQLCEVDLKLHRWKLLEKVESSGESISKYLLNILHDSYFNLFAHDGLHSIKKPSLPQCYRNSLLQDCLYKGEIHLS